MLLITLDVLDLLVEMLDELKILDLLLLDIADDDDTFEDEATTEDDDVPHAFTKP